MGKVRLAFTPWLNHSWHVPLYVSARGLTTSLIYYEDRAFEIVFDFNRHVLEIVTSEGSESQLPLKPRSVAAFFEAVARRGSKGFAFLARHVDGPQSTFNIYRADEARKDPLIEIMGIGRSIAIPPSIHAKTGRPYQWINPDTGKQRPAGWELPALADLPEIATDDIEKLKAALEPWSRKPRPPRPMTEGPAPVPTNSTSKRYRAFALRGLEKATAGLAGLKEGRPSELFRATCGLGWTVAHRVLTEAEFVNGFAAACEANGLAARDGRRAIEASIRSGLQRAINDPLPVLEDRPREKRDASATASKLNGAHAARSDWEAATTATSATNACDKPQMSQKSQVSQEGGALFADEPLPLFREPPKGEAFPVEALGSTLGGMAKALHEAAVRSPLAICGTAVLAAAACATQALRDVDLPIAGGQPKPLSLYFLAIAQSGERKTATDAQALKPIRTRSEELRHEYDEAHQRYRNALDAWTAERKNVLGDKRLDASARRSKLEALGREPSAPKSPILILQEPTLEGLTKHLKVGYPSVGLFSSEGGQFIGGHAMSDDAKRRSAAALNALWDDGRLERVRATEDIALLPGRRLSVFLQAQPDVAQHFLSDPILQDIGLLARFLITQPDSTMGSRTFRQLAPQHQAAITTYCVKLLALLRRDLPYDERGDGLVPPRLIMSNEAQTHWIDFADHIETMLAPGGDLREISGFANKLPEHAARIAAVLQIFDDPEAEELSADYLARGIELAEFYASEADRLHSAARVGTELREAEKLRVWLDEKWDQSHVTVRDIQRSGPGSLREKARIERTLGILTDHNWVAKVSNAQVSERITRVAWAIKGRMQ